MKSDVSHGLMAQESGFQTKYSHLEFHIWWGRAWDREPSSYKRMYSILEMARQQTLHSLASREATCSLASGLRGLQTGTGKGLGSPPPKPSCCEGFRLFPNDWEEHQDPPPETHRQSPGRPMLPTELGRWGALAEWCDGTNFLNASTHLPWAKSELASWFGQGTSLLWALVHSSVEWDSWTERF